MSRAVLGLALGLAGMAACVGDESGDTAPPLVAQPSEAPQRPARLVADLPPEARQGGALMRGQIALYLADEDRSALRVIPLPVEADGERIAHQEVALPGRPAAVLPVGDRVLVTIRDPGLLMAFDVTVDGGLQESGRVTLASDAWGIGITPDASTALVTSAWTRRVSAVDLDSMTLRWSVPVPREPRAVVVMAGGERAYVTHLVGSALTRIDGISGQPEVTRVAFPSAPLRNPGDAYAEQRAEAASLAYSAVLSPDEERLFVPRHAIGASGKLAWNGQSTVDVLLTADESPLAQPRLGRAPLSRIDVPLEERDSFVRGTGPIQNRPFMSQPRATVLRHRSNTLLIASEGRDALVELDAASIDPSAHALRSYDLDPPADFVGIDDFRFGDTQCGAPTGVALSQDEMTAYVFCRSTASMAVVRLADYTADEKDAPKRFGAVLSRLSLADDSLDEQAALGRRLFYDGRDGTMSFGFGCAGCHPEGRDDGHVWHEIGTGTLRAFPEHQGHNGLPELKGEARQTPMLAGRLNHDGPFGWRGSSDTLAMRIIAGFNLHHWWDVHWIDESMIKRAEAIAAFLRSDGMVPPPEATRELSPLEERGKQLFEDATTGCASCHRQEDGLFSDGERVRLDLRAADARFRGDEKPIYRTPPLRFVAGTEPFLHDGSAATLMDLLENNHDRMGLTSQLTKRDRQALVAFMETLGGAELADSLRELRQRPTRSVSARTPSAPPMPSASPATSDKPSDDEWAAAPEHELARVGTPCHVRQVREWVRIRCKVYATEVELIGGSAEGVALSHSEPYNLPPREWWQSWQKVDDAVMEFPLRPGDRRIFQLVSSEFVRWGGVDLDAELVVSALWLDGAASATITAH